MCSHTKPVSLIVAIAAAFALGVCGGSKEDKALNAACSAKDGLKTQDGQLKAFTPATDDDLSATFEATYGSVGCQ